MNNYPTDDDDDAGAIANAIPSKQERLLIKRPRGRTRMRVCVAMRIRKVSVGGVFNMADSS